MDMESNQRNPKTKTLGHLPVEKVKMMKEWSPYKAAAAEFSKAKHAAAQTKRAVREALKQRQGLKSSILLRKTKASEFSKTYKRRKGGLGR